MEFDLQEYKSAWKLDPSVRHLNHGSYGAVTTGVLQEQQKWRDLMQFNPVAFYSRICQPAIIEARTAVAKYLGQKPEQIAFVRNTTEGASTTMRAFPFKAGDEAIVLDHEYGAVTYAVKRAVDAAGAKLVEVVVPRIATDEESIKLIEAALTSKTRMLVVDHVTSATARTFPIYELADICRARNIAFVVDASHSPGNIDTDLDRLDADFWFGNLHKWVAAPPGAGVYRIAPRWQDQIRPLIVSWQDDMPYPLPWDMLGTVDVTAWLAAPAAFKFYADLGWERVRKANQTRMRYGRDLIMNELGVSRDELREEDLPLGVVPLHKMSGGRDGCFALQKRFAEVHKIEVPITTFSDKYFMRISGQLYNTPDDYDALLTAVRVELK